MNSSSLSSINLLWNGIGIKRAMQLANMLESHPTLNSLCGNEGDDVELDMTKHGQAIGAEGAIMLSAEIR